MQTRGWIRLHRKSQNSEVWTMKPDVWKLWCYLKMEARNIDDPKRYEGVIVIRGELFTSLDRISRENEWVENKGLRRWSRKQVSRMLDQLEAAGSIKCTSHKFGTHIKLINFSRYNPKKDEHRTTGEQQGNNRGTTGDILEECKNVIMGEDNTPLNPPREDTEKSAAIEEFVSTWKTCQDFAQPTKLTDKRKSLIWGRMKNKDWRANWKAAFERATRSDFCCGRVTGWKANIEWFLRPDKIYEILEGKHDNRKESSNGQSRVHTGPGYEFCEDAATAEDGIRLPTGWPGGKTDRRSD